jgi:hypothetical protein
MERSTKPLEVFILLKIVSPTQFYFTFTAAGSNNIFGIRHLYLLPLLVRGLQQLTDQFRLIRLYVTNLYWRHSNLRLVR